MTRAWPFLILALAGFSCDGLSESAKLHYQKFEVLPNGAEKRLASKQESFLDGNGNVIRRVSNGPNLFKEEHFDSEGNLQYLKSEFAANGYVRKTEKWIGPNGRERESKIASREIASGEEEFFHFRSRFSEEGEEVVGLIYQIEGSDSTLVGKTREFYPEKNLRVGETYVLEDSAMELVATLSRVLDGEKEVVSDTLRNLLTTTVQWTNYFRKEGKLDSTAQFRVEFPGSDTLLMETRKNVYGIDMRIQEEWMYDLNRGRTYVYRRKE